MTTATDNDKSITDQEVWSQFHRQLQPVVWAIINDNEITDDEVRLLLDIMLFNMDDQARAAFKENIQYIEQSVRNYLQDAMEKWQRGEFAGPDQQELQEIRRIQDEKKKEEEEEMLEAQKARDIEKKVGKDNMEEIILGLAKAAKPAEMSWVDFLGASKQTGGRSL